MRFLIGAFVALVFTASGPTDSPAVDGKFLVAEQLDASAAATTSATAPTSYQSSAVEHAGQVGENSPEKPIGASVRDRIVDRCPTEAPRELMRDNAHLFGGSLCRISARNARSNTAAAAVVEGFQMLGTPYSLARRAEAEYADCSSFVSKAYIEAGVSFGPNGEMPSSMVFRNADWSTPVDDAQPGDVLWREGHVMLALSNGFMIHASAPGDVVHVARPSRVDQALAVELRPGADAVEDV